MKKSLTASAILAVALLVGASSTANAKKTEFYYQTYGGFIEGTVVGNAYQFIPGYNDVEEDGIWHREGPFSKDVQFGNQNEGNKKDIRDQIYGYTSWPAITWGHPEENPWISEGGAGDDLGGASGAGLIGYGYKDAVKKGGRKIVVGENKVLFPLGAVQHHNYNISFFGSMDVNVSWNMELYDKKGKLVFQGHNIFQMSQWETVNYNLKPNDCPRTQWDEGQSKTDTQFNTDQNEISNWWPITGLGDLYSGDGNHDAAMPCADAFSFKGGVSEAHFKVTDEKSGKETDYTITIDGFWEYTPDAKGCPKLDKGLYNVPKGDKKSAWNLKCFKKNPTFWSDENSVNTGWVRLQITEDKAEAGTTCKDMKPIDKLALTWNGTGIIQTINVWNSEIGKGGPNGAPLNVITGPISKDDQIIVDGLSRDNAKDIVFELLDAAGNQMGISMFHLSCSEDKLNDCTDCGGEVGSGKSNDGTNDWIFNGMSGAGEEADPTKFCPCPTTP